MKNIKEKKLSSFGPEGEGGGGAKNCLMHDINGRYADFGIPILEH